MLYNLQVYSTVTHFLFCFVFFGGVGSLLLHMGFLQLRRTGATLCCGVWASHCGGFSSCRTRTQGTRASVVVAHGLGCCGSQALEHRLSSCGAQAQLFHGMWDLPRPGMEPVSPAFAGGFLTTAPPGKSPQFLKVILHLDLSFCLFTAVNIALRNDLKASFSQINIC